MYAHTSTYINRKANLNLKSKTKSKTKVAATAKSKRYSTRYSSVDCKIYRM